MKLLYERAKRYSQLNLSERSKLVDSFYESDRGETIHIEFTV